MQYIQRHQLAIIAYLAYFAMWLRDIVKDVHLKTLEKTMSAGQQLPRGEWAGGLTIFMGVVFAMIIAANAIGRSKDQTGFYLIMLALILVPLIVLCKY